MKKISAENLGLAVGSYLETELVPKSNGIQKVGLYLAIPLMQCKAQDLYRQYAPVLEFMECLEEDGLLNLDSLHQQLKAAVGKTGKVSLLGIVFDEDDVEKVYTAALPYVQEG